MFLVITSVMVSGPREGETSLKTCVNYEFYVYKLSKLFRKSPKRLLQNTATLSRWKIHQKLLYSKNPPKQFGAVSPHSSPSCLPGKTFCLHFCDTVAGFFIYSHLLLLTFICPLLFVVGST
jgi:hypothetical protein